MAADSEPSGLSSWFRSFCCSVLQTGEIPRHVAIIMDGNRRFAVKMHQERSVGHSMGFEKLTDVCDSYCVLLSDFITSVDARVVSGSRSNRGDRVCVQH